MKLLLFFYQSPATSWLMSHLQQKRPATSSYYTTIPCPFLQRTCWLQALHAETWSKVSMTQCPLDIFRLDWSLQLAVTKQRLQGLLRAGLWSWQNLVESDLLDNAQKEQAVQNQPIRTSSWSESTYCNSRCVGDCNPGRARIYRSHFTIPTNWYNLRVFAPCVLHQTHQTVHVSFGDPFSWSCSCCHGFMARSHCKILAKMLDIMCWNGTQRSMIEIG